MSLSSGVRYVRYQLGERRRVRLFAYEREGDTHACVFEDLNSPGVAYCCLYRRPGDVPDAPKGATGLLVWTAGGPLGGYWRWEQD